MLATDAGWQLDSTLARLSANVALNPLAAERVSVCELRWGHEPHIRALHKRWPAGFDTVLASDVLYYPPETYGRLAETADELRSADARLAAELCDTAQGLQSQLDAHQTELEQTAAQLEAQTGARQGSAAPERRAVSFAEDIGDGGGGEAVLHQSHADGALGGSAEGREAFAPSTPLSDGRSDGRTDGLEPEPVSYPAGSLVRVAADAPRRLESWPITVFHVPCRS